MKKLMIVALMVTLVGCNKQPANVAVTPSSPSNGTGTEVNVTEQFFNQDEISKAGSMVDTYLAILNKENEKSVKTSDELDHTKTEIKKSSEDLLHPDATITLMTSIIQDNHQRLFFPSDSFKVHEDQVKESYFTNINAHMLTLPVDYKTSTGKEITYHFNFIKTQENELQLINGLLINGVDLAEKDQSVYDDEYTKQEVQSEIKEMNIQ